MNPILIFWFTPIAYTALTALGILLYQWRKQGVRGALLSFVTVTLNFAYHVIGLLRGDPRKFEVIRKYVPKGINTV